jgi:hypothetical protein
MLVEGPQLDCAAGFGPGRIHRGSEVFTLLIPSPHIW